MNPSTSSQTSNIELVKVPASLPDITENLDRNEVRIMLQKFAAANNFVLTVADSSATKLHHKCERGGYYENTRKLKDDERQRLKTTRRIGCPYYIRITKKKNSGFNYKQPKTEMEVFHNHKLDEGNISTSSAGRKMLLTDKENESIFETLDQKITTRAIVDSINQGQITKITVNDVNNIKYDGTAETIGDKTATDFIKYIESKDYRAVYKINEKRTLDGIFITNDTMIERTRRFKEVILIDATYNTNIRKMPLICAYGVSNLGGMQLKTFIIAFAFVVNEKEETYTWFVKTLRDVIENIEDNTVFITDKCKQLISQLDKFFPQNKKLLCAWHMVNNLNKKLNTTIFKDQDMVGFTRDTVENMINSYTELEYRSHCNSLYSVLNDPSKFVSEEKQKDLSKYIRNEWKDCEEKWAGCFASNIQHFDNITSQRAESGHNIIKNGLSAKLPLQTVFQKIERNLTRFELDYTQEKNSEANKIDILLFQHTRLFNLFGKVSKRALIAISLELKRDLEQEKECDCRSKKLFGIPCVHSLAQIKDRPLQVSDIPERWLLESKRAEMVADLPEEAPELTLSKPMSWMKYLTALEYTFRSSEENLTKQLHLIDGIKSLLGIELNDDSIPGDFLRMT